MKLDLTQVLHGYDGQPLYEQAEEDLKPGEERKEQTLRNVLLVALNSFTRPELDPDNGQYIGPVEKAHLFYLSNKLFEGGTVKFKAVDLPLLQERVGKIWPPVIVGRVNELLDGPDEDEDEDEDEEGEEVE